MLFNPAIASKLPFFLRLALLPLQPSTKGLHGGDSDILIYSPWLLKAAVFALTALATGIVTRVVLVLLVQANFSMWNRNRDGYKGTEH